MGWLRRKRCQQCISLLDFRERTLEVERIRIPFYRIDGRIPNSACFILRAMFTMNRGDSEH